MGNVLSAGIGQAPARQAAHLRRHPEQRRRRPRSSKVCGSGMQAIIFGAKTIALGDADLVVAGGMESMSNVPVLPREGAHRATAWATARSSTG